MTRSPVSLTLYTIHGRAFLRVLGDAAFVGREHLRKRVITSFGEEYDGSWSWDAMTFHKILIKTLGVKWCAMVATTADCWIE